ncbi:dTDP-4-dehydrorhamnose reductase [Candidatus Woesearchaeota archaeon]|jgi:dTDP-4-dehydrorhamnose reductase|nr:dTDP-4-dehydrorhamnose reductase [Candidatus Woesearchaeota archaeon]
MKILITGGNGALGESLIKTFPDAFAPSHKDMDVTDKESMAKVILDYKPDVVIHAAAIVGIRECEEDKDKARQTNVEGTQNIVDALKKLNNNCYLVYMSTACVFAGENEKYYTEDDEPNPKNYYSQTKKEGESVAMRYPNTVIIRTNFVPKKQWKYPKAFVDRFGTYLFADQVAKGIKEVIEKRETGIIHIVGDKRMSMYELAILAGSKDVGKMTLKEYNGPPLTVDMSLSTKRWKKYKIE